MEYEDELDRMRARRQRQRARRRIQEENSGGRRVSRDGRVSERDPERRVGRDGRVSERDPERRVGRGSRVSERDSERPVRRKVPPVRQVEGEPARRKKPSTVHGPESSDRSRRSGYREEERYEGRRRSTQEDLEDEDFYETEYEEAPRGQRRKKRRRFGVLKIFLAFVILAGAYLGYQWIQAGYGFWTIAVFGVDSRNGNLEKGALSDVEMLCVIDRKTGEIKLVSVYRDTYLEISSDGTYHKINEAYFKGGHKQAIEALERNLDLEIDDYATFNWKAVADAITILGGIDLEISESEFKYINGFITETVESTGLGSHHLEHAGMNHLDGVQAVAYARLRLMDTDYNRTARQRLVIQLAMNKAKEADFETLTTLVQAILPQLSTSVGIDDILPMARNIKKYHIGESGGFPFSRGETHIGKKDCVIPLTLESNVVQLHQFLYGTEQFQPSETVKQISARIASDSGMGQVAENAPEARVEGQKALQGGSGSSGGGSGSGAGNSSSGDGNDGTKASQETVSGEGVGSDTTAESTSEEESTVESSEETSEESSPEASEDTTAEGRDQQQVEGPGSQTESSGVSQGPGGSSGGPGDPGNSTDSGTSGGPGFDGPGGSGLQPENETSVHIYEEKPVMESTEAVGPGV